MLGVHTIHNYKLYFSMYIFIFIIIKSEHDYRIESAGKRISSNTIFRNDHKYSIILKIIYYIEIE